MVCQNDAADKLVNAFKPLENIESEFQRLKQQVLKFFNYN